jgi:hypothetical protein
MDAMAGAAIRVRDRWTLLRMTLFVLLAMSTVGCARRAVRVLPNLEIPVRCASAITLVGCDARVTPPKCKSARVTYARGCEEIVVRK